MTTLFFVAGEASGDRHTAEVITHIKQQRPDISCVGLGGEHMKNAGTEIFFNLPTIAAVGIVEVLLKYHLFHKVFHDALQKVDELKPAAVILTDFPGFNLRFAKEMKKRNIPVIYYVSPQVWAWKKKRIHTIPKIVDKMLVLFPFEERLYTDPNMEVEFVGHPLVHQVTPSASKEVLRKEFKIADEKKVILLMPGSRRAEVKRIFPIMKKAVMLLSEDDPDLHILIAKSPLVTDELFSRELSKAQFPYTLIEDRPYDCFAAADFGLIKSGTSTLEATVMGLPYILIYSANVLTYLIARAVVTIPFLGLANIIAGKEIVPEFLQYNAKPRSIAECARSLMQDPEKIEIMKKEMEKVRTKLGTGDASRNAASAILSHLGSHQ